MTKDEEIKVLKAKLSVAERALELAEGIMDYCGDAWERECTEKDRDEFAKLYEEFKRRKV